MKDKDIICYTEVREKKVPCAQEGCRHFLHSEKNYNCAILAAEKGPLTLQEIGDIFGVSRMRICQIEKTILKKIKKSANSLKESD